MDNKEWTIKNGKFKCKWTIKIKSENSKQTKANKTTKSNHEFNVT